MGTMGTPVVDLRAEVEGGMGRWRRLAAAAGAAGRAAVGAAGAAAGAAAAAVAEGAAAGTEVMVGFTHRQCTTRQQCATRRRGPCCPR